MEDCSAFAASQAEDSEGTPDHRGCKRPLTEAQRKAKNESDRKRRQEHRVEFKRLKNVELLFNQIAPQFANLNRKLQEANQRLKDRESVLNQRIKELETALLEYQTQNKEPQTDQNPLPWDFFTDMELDSLGETPAPSEPVENSETVTEAEGSVPQTDNMRYADELVEDFTKKLDAMDKSQVDFSDFKGLKEEIETSGICNLPPSLAPIDERLKTAYGDITADCRLSTCLVRPGYILLCSVIKEMDELKLNQVEEKKMLFWRDVIHSCLSLGLRGEFAANHLKNIARAYYGLKAWNDRDDDQKDLESIEHRLSELRIQLSSLEETHARRLKEHKSEVRQQCIHVAEQFWGKPLSTYLFSPSPPGF